MSVKMRRRGARDKKPEKQDKKIVAKKRDSEGGAQLTRLQQLKLTEGPEEWRVLDIDPTVKVSSWGRVKRHGKLTDLGRDKDGYQRITLKGKSY